MNDISVQIAVLANRINKIVGTFSFHTNNYLSYSYFIDFNWKKNESKFILIWNLSSYFLEQLVSSAQFSKDTKWKRNGVTIAGGNGRGNQLNQLSEPYGIYVNDDDQCIYIANRNNHRIDEWKFGAKTRRVVVCGNGAGNRIDQLDNPTDIIFDKKNDSFIICDQSNRRVVQWSRQNGPKGQTIISNIVCCGITMDNNGNLYASDCVKHEVRRWKIGERRVEQL